LIKKIASHARMPRAIAPPTTPPAITAVRFPDVTVLWGAGEADEDGTLSVGVEIELVEYVEVSDIGGLSETGATDGYDTLYDEAAVGVGTKGVVVSAIVDISV